MKEQFLWQRELAVNIKINKGLTDIFKFNESVISEVSWQQDVPFGQSCSVIVLR